MPYNLGIRWPSTSKQRKSAARGYTQTQRAPTNTVSTSTRACITDCGKCRLTLDTDWNVIVLLLSEQTCQRRSWISPTIRCRLHYTIRMLNQKKYRVIWKLMPDNSMSSRRSNFATMSFAFVQYKRRSGRSVYLNSSITSNSKLNGGIFQIIVRDLLRDKVEIHIYDAIFVCIGNNSAPKWPKPPYPGFRIFRGKQSHSHDYRRAEAFEGDFRYLLISLWLLQFHLVGFGQARTCLSSVRVRVASIWLHWYQGRPNAFTLATIHMIPPSLSRQMWLASVR